MISASLVKIAALGGMALVWWEFTCESIKLGQKIIFSSWQEDVCEQHIDDEEIYSGEELVEKCEDPSCEICI